MADVFAGFICGYALSLLVTPVTAFALIRARASSEQIRRAMPEGTSLTAISVIVHVFAILALTAVGIVFGMILAGMEDRAPAGGLGGPNRAFTALVLTVSGIAVLPLAVVRPRWWKPLLAATAVFAATFGWLLPYLAELSPSS